MAFKPGQRPTPPAVTNKGRTFRPQPLTRAEIDALIDAASRRASSGIRIRALIAVMAGAGLRVSEAIDLMPADINTTDGTLRVNDGKGHKARTVGITGRFLDLVETWLDHRRTLGLNGRHPVFATYSANAFGTKLKPPQVRTAMTRLGEKAGLEKRVHPHGLRHSLAYAMAQQGIPLQIIQKQLGHASLAATGIYIDHLMPREVIDTMRHLDW